MFYDSIRGTAVRIRCQYLLEQSSFVVVLDAAGRGFASKNPPRRMFQKSGKQYAFFAQPLQERRRHIHSDTVLRGGFLWSTVKPEPVVLVNRVYNLFAFTANL